MHVLKKIFIKTTGYWIYKKKELNTGVDFIIDIENHFPQEFSSIKTVFDVGANLGLSAKKFSAEFVQSTIYSFEPEIDTFNKLKENTNNLKNVSVFNMGVGEKNEKMELFHGKYSGWNSLVPGINKTEKKSLVDIKKIDDIINDLKLSQIDVLKTDTEGYDINVLKGANYLIRSGNIKFIYIESGFYESNKRNSNIFEIMEYLKDYDYHLFSLYEIGKGGSYMVNGNALFVHASVVGSRYESVHDNYKLQE